ncbi:TPA: prepilin-type N-terminal cleavage/methylation domain-containing protein [Providencia rettgeri]|uniref:type IV pilus modification PilV family protein n=1 Tax=Providencia sp. PROV129 TaxID=2949839 RepID=UPI002349F3D2|nr:prepilin-type N-terminal cleavage/methylation domain-containing protein [Providencia rettgeri]
MKNNRIAGYSLFEVIVALGIIGVIMIPLSRFMINQIENNHRQHISDAIVDEIYRFIDFINNDEMEKKDNNFIRNPLFQKEQKNIAYSKRTSNYKIEDAITTDGKHFNWGTGENSDRNLFIDETCKGSLLGISLKKEFLKCTMDALLVEHPEFSIERVDLVGDEVKKTIERVDFIILYHPIEDKQGLYIESFYGNFSEAFKNKFLYLTQASFVKRNHSMTNAGWELIKVDNENLQFGNLASHAELVKSSSFDYGLRLSFNVKAGKFLRADGSVNADKLCWNTKTNQYGPCLKAKDENTLVLTSGKTDNEEKSPTLCWDRENKTQTTCLALKKQDPKFPITDAQYLPESNFMLTDTDSKGNEVTGTLVANVIIEDSYYEGNKLIKEYRTVPEVSYHNFTGNNDKKMIVEEDYVGDDVNEEGKIIFPIKKCPVVQNVRLWPRLTVAVSSMMPVVYQNDKKLDIDLSKEYSTRKNKITNVGLAAGVVLQPRNTVINGKNVWMISASLGVNNPALAESKTYVNPKSLSIMAVEWCSSIKGDYNGI